MIFIGFLLGALIPTFLVSRLYLRLSKSWDGGATRLLIVHGMSLVTAGLLAGMGMADGGAFVGMQAITAYAIPQGFWLVFDLIKLRRKAL